MGDIAMSAKTLIIMIIEVAASFILVFGDMFATLHFVTDALGELPD